MVSTKDENDQALHFLCHHLSPTLKDEYMAMTSAKVLWDALQERFERLKYTIKPLAEQEWVWHRFCDYKYAREYNSVLHRIYTLLCLCGKEITEEEKIEKTLMSPWLLRIRSIPPIILKLYKVQLQEHVHNN